MTKTDANFRELVNVAVNSIDSPFSGSMTYTSLFMIPAFDIYINEEWVSVFVNTFINDKELAHTFSRPLFFLSAINEESEKETAAFEKMEAVLKTNKHFVYDYVAGYHNNRRLVMFVFECPEKHHADYDAFMNGQYSEFSKEYKDRFHKTVSKGKDTYESPVYGALIKSDKLKQKVEQIIGDTLHPSQEYWGSLVPHYEVFRCPPPKRTTKTPTDEPIKVQTPET